MKLKNLIIKICVLTLFLSALSFVEAQKKKLVRKKTVRTAMIETNSASIPELKDYAFVVQIDKDANVTVRIQNTEDSEFLANSSSVKPLTDFFSAFSSLQNTKASVKTKNLLNPIIIIKADWSLNFGEVVKVIQSLRGFSTQKIKIQIAENLYAAVPPQIDDENIILKPNPTFLLVALEKDSKIRINQEEMGDFENTSPLRDKLKEIFKYREQNGVLRPGTNEVERTVFVKAPLSVKFNNVIRLVQSIAGTGASPIGLQVDDLEQ